MSPAWIAFSWLSALSYLANVRFSATGRWAAPTWVMCVEFGALFALGLWSAIRKRRRPEQAHR